MARFSPLNLAPLRNHCRGRRGGDLELTLALGGNNELARADEKTDELRHDEIPGETELTGLGRRVHIGRPQIKETGRAATVWRMEGWGIIYLWSEKNLRLLEYRHIELSGLSETLSEIENDEGL